MGCIVRNNVRKALKGLKRTRVEVDVIFNLLVPSIKLEETWNSSAIDFIHHVQFIDFVIIIRFVFKRASECCLVGLKFDQENWRYVNALFGFIFWAATGGT